MKHYLLENKESEGYTLKFRANNDEDAAAFARVILKRHNLKVLHSNLYVTDSEYNKIENTDKGYLENGELITDMFPYQWVLI